MEWMSNPEYWVALLALTVLEIVLGIDNIAFDVIFVDGLETGDVSGWSSSGP